MENRVRKRKKINYIIVAIFALILLSVCVISLKISNVNKEKMVLENNALANVDYVGESGSVTYSNITTRKTGTAGFDSVEQAGNDISESNNIVRSFDKIKWQIDVNMGIKEGISENNLQGGIINIEVTLPESCSNVTKWDTNLMSWANDVEEYINSSNQRVFKAKYYMDETKITVPGKQNLEVILNVNDASNNQEILANFKVWLEGNEETEKYTFSDNDAVIVSAAPKYNIALTKNGYLSEKTVLNIDGNEQLGRVYGYAFNLQLYNDSVEKGLKGIEIPKDDISFDIDLKLEREIEDITDVCTPILWNYKRNIVGMEGVIPNRSMDFGNSSEYAREIIPLSNATENRENSIYNSGDISMVQNGDKISVVVSGYAFDSIFPKYNYFWDSYVYNPTSLAYTENIGCFSAGYFQVVVPYNEASTVQGNNYYLTVSDSNLSAKSLSNVEVNTQVNNEDDSNRTKHYIDYTGYLSQALKLTNLDYSNLDTSAYSEDAYAYPGQNLLILTKFTIDLKGDNDIYTAEKIIKFDGDMIVPTLLSDGKKYKTDHYDGDMEFNVWYLCKKDGKNWSNKQELDNAEVRDLDLYENLSDIPSDKICVGMFFESKKEDREGYGRLARSSGGVNQLVIPIKVKDTAKIGNVGEITEHTRMWVAKIDRDIYTVMNEEDVQYPPSNSALTNFDYTVTSYDEQGNIIEKEENLNYATWAESLLITGAKQGIEVKSLNLNTMIEKTNYDIGKNENQVSYIIKPYLEKLTNEMPDINNVTVNIKFTLPSGLTYIPGSFSKEAYETTSGHNTDFEYETDAQTGETTLIWNIYGCTVGENLDSYPIYLDVKIDENTLNDTIFKTTAVISADREKVGNIAAEYRKSTSEIKITNLSSHRLYKDVKTPVIEKNGTITYVLSYSNKTDSDVDHFQVLDILPYNKSLSEKLFNGDYILEKIDVVQKDQNGSEINNDLKIYVTNDENARNIKANDSSIGDAGNWTLVNSNQILNVASTAFAVNGTVEKNTGIEIEFSLKTNNNLEKDRYLNHATARVSEDATDSDLITTTEVEATVVSREISGMVWFDQNENGIKDNNEPYLQNVEVELVNISGIDTFNTITNENGEYKFSSLPIGVYYVKIYPDSIYNLTQKNVGSNSAINSKFSEISGIKQSYQITKLNSLSEPILSQEYINAGLILKDANVTVKYLDENDNEITYPDVDDEGHDIQRSYSYELNGKVGDEYSTSQLDIPNYRFMNSTNNTSGNMTEENIEVIYRYAYNKRNIEATKIWDDNNNYAQKRPDSLTIELYADDSLVDSYNIIDTSSNSNTHTFSDLVKYNNDGSEIVYTIKEKQNQDDDLKFYTSTVDNNNYIITNVFEVPDEKKEITAKVNWIDENNKSQKRPSKVIVELYANSSLLTRKEVETTGYLQECYFGEVPKYDELGNEIIYTIDEKEKVSDDLKFYAKSVNNSTYTITNTFAVPDDKIDILATLNWIDYENQNNTRPQSIIVHLMNKDQIVRSFSLTDIPTNYTYIFEDVAKYDENGDEIEYTLFQDDVEGYYKLIEGFVIRNTLKEYDVLTRVEGEGGTITDINEKVPHGGYSSKSIVVTPNLGYEIDKITINGNDIDYDVDEDGVAVISKFLNVKENKEVVASFKRKDAKVIVRYVLEDGTLVAPNEIINGKVGDEYTTEKKDFDEYDLIQVSDNDTGTMTIENIVVNYVYKKVVGSIKIKVVDEDNRDIVIVGANFTVEKIKDDGEVDHDFNIIEIASDKNGSIVLDELKIGTYRIKQISSSEGYNISKDIINVTINKDNRNVERLVLNRKQNSISRNVDTGDKVIIFVLVLVAAVVILSITIVVQKKISKKN